MDEIQTTPNKKVIPIWVCVFIVILFTVSAFWLFGGQHYLAHKSDIDYGYFHHPEDDSDPLNWFSFLLGTGQLAGFIAFVGTVVAVIVINKRHK